MKKLLLSCIFIITISVLKINAQIPGDLDTSFDTTGILILQPGTFNDEVFDVATQHDGKILYCGTARVVDTSGTNTDIVIGRRNNDGSNDTTFGINGSVVKDFGVASDYAYKMTLQPDGKIVVVGAASMSSTNTNWVIIRLMPDGSYDSTFNSNGIVILALDSGEDYAYDVLIQPDNKILVAGISKDSGLTYDRATVARFNPDGTLDSSFATNGVSIIQPTLNTLSQTIRSVKLLPGGNIVACGWNIKNSVSRILLAGFNSNGNLNPAFGLNGIYLNNTGIEQGNDLQVIDGHLYVGGTSSSSGGYDLTLTRLDTLGVLDNLFGANGTVRFSINSVNACNRMVIQPDGKILAAGVTGLSAIADQDFLVVRFLQNGITDPSFGNNGTSVISVCPDFDDANSIALQDDGKIILGGIATFTDNDMSIARLLNDSGAIFNFVPSQVIDNSGWTIYPSPVTGNEFYLAGDFSGSHSLDISVYDINGELISKYNSINLPAKDQQMMLSLPASTANGIYYVKISTSEQSNVLPLVKF